MNIGSIIRTFRGLDGRRIESASGDKVVKLWDAGTGRELQTFSGHGRASTPWAFKSRGRSRNRHRLRGITLANAPPDWG